MNPGGASRRTPPLLPSASLSGLEQFVPPERPSHSSLGPSWRFKPLPDLPKRGLRARPLREVGVGRPVFSEEPTIHSARDTNFSLQREKLEIRHHYLDRSTKPKHASSPQLHRRKKSIDVGHSPSTKRPPSFSRDGRWSPFPNIKPLPSLPILSAAPKAENASRRKNEGDALRRPSSPTIPSDLYSPLLPAPLAPGAHRIGSAEHAVPPVPRIPDNPDFYRRRGGDPSQQYNTISWEGRSSFGQAQRRERGSIPRSTASNNPTGGEAAEERYGPLDGIESAHHRRSTSSDYANGTGWYSRSSMASNRNTYNDDSDSNEEPEDIDCETYRLTHRSVHSGPGSPTPQPHRRFIQRPKQLAIPPTEYQKHGSKIWSSAKKQDRGALFPRCLQRFLPRSWRPPDYKATKNRKGDSESEKYGSTLPLSPPPPPRPPRPASRYQTHPPSLPYLTLAREFDASDIIFSYADNSPSFPPEEFYRRPHTFPLNAPGLREEVHSSHHPDTAEKTERFEIRSSCEPLLSPSPFPTEIVDGEGSSWL